MRLSWKTDGVMLVIIAAMFIGSVIAWPAAPDSMPTHWNIQGEVDGYGSKFVGLLLLPIVVVGIYGMFLVLPRIDPRRANYARFAGVYTLLRVTMVLFMGALHGVMLLGVWGIDAPMGTVMPVLVGVLLMVIGNFMGKLRPTWFVGIRTPWTLTSDLSWSKTHRLGGWVFVAGGLLMAIGGPLFGGWGFGAALGVLMGGVVWLFVYSYLVWRKDPDRTRWQDAMSSGGRPPEGSG